jgi:hypothetical protein
LMIESSVECVSVVIQEPGPAFSED